MFYSLCVSLLYVGQAAANADVPPPRSETVDAVMAPAREVEEVAAWGATVFDTPAPAPTRRVNLRVETQEYNVLRFGQSCMETPLRIGSKAFEHGLGTHAHSAIVVDVPEGAQTFEAMVGVDHNDDTGGTRGSVTFAVKAGSAALFQSAVLKGSDEPAAVRVDIPAGTKQLRLEVDTTPDGPSCDQADWADARFVNAAGQPQWLDADQPEPFFLSTTPPFSFKLGGEPSTAVLERSKRTVERLDRPDRREYHVTWTDPQTGLEVRAVAGVFKQYPAVEWLLSFANTGSRDTPILDSIASADVLLRTGNSQHTPVLHQLHGDACGEDSFLPFDTPVDTTSPRKLAPSGGRSSNTTAFPFFNLEYHGEGVIVGVGWSGQWAAAIERGHAGASRLTIGLEQARLVLHPGESIRGPRVLCMTWKGNRAAAQNRFRRLLLFHYVPRDGDHPLTLPIVSQCFDRYVSTRPDWATEAGQLKAVKAAHDMGCDTHWLDAAWFPGGFPNGVGSWSARTDTFPHGLKPLADACHALGMRFVLWFEPERVAPGSAIAREHPEFVHGGAQGGLFKLDDPSARRWLGDLLSGRIGEYGIDVYRNDFNMDPLPTWRQTDEPNRQGITEIRYVTGLYELWDRLRAEHPGLLIDNCSSGGRRIDLETIMRSVPLWRSDTGCSPGHPDWNQLQTAGLGQYVPLHTSCGWSPSAYEFRSSATGGAISQFDWMNPDFPLPSAQAAISEARANRPYFYGDFYPLTACTADPAQFVAYQFHRPDLSAGLVLAFRRRDCELRGIIVGLEAIDANARYEVVTIDDERHAVTQQLSGSVLTNDLTLKMPTKGTSLVIRYRRIDP